MAAIIAQMAAANRERKKRLVVRNQVPCNKSGQLLPRFDESFDPAKHNKYARRKLDQDRRRRIIEAVQAKHLEEMETLRQAEAEKVFINKLDKCRHEIDLDLGLTEEEQVSRILHRMAANEKRTLLCINIFKAASGFLFVVAFCLILTYFYLTFHPF